MRRRASMKTAALALALTAAPLAGTSSSPQVPRSSFEGRVQLRLQDTDPQGANYAVRGDRIRIDIPSVGGTHDVHAIVDLTRDRVMVSSPHGGWMPEVVYPQANATERVPIERTGRMRAVVGQPCEVWTMTEGRSTVEACVVPGVPWFDPRQIVGGHVPDWSRALQARRAFPVSVWVGDPRTRFAMWATGVERVAVPGAEFAAPRTAKGR